MATLSATEIRRLRKQLKNRKKSIDPKKIAQLIRAGVQPSQYTSLQGFKKGGSTSKKVSKVAKQVSLRNVKLSCKTHDCV